MKDKDNALMKASRTKNPIDRKLARKARNRVNVLIRNAKINFAKENLENYKDNPEQIKSVMPTSNLTNPITLQNDVGNKLSNREAATVVNTFFANISSDLAEGIKERQPNNLVPTTLCMPALGRKLSLQQPTHQEILHWVKKIHVFKSSGLPLIASMIWKLLFDRIPDIFFHMVETIFNTFVFPQG